MSMLDKVNSAIEIKGDISDAIEAKGVSMTGVSFGGYAAKIGEISGGGGNGQIISSYVQGYTGSLSTGEIVGAITTDITGDNEITPRLTYAYITCEGTTFSSLVTDVLIVASTNNTLIFNGTGTHYSACAYGVSIDEGNATFSGAAYGVSIGEGNATFSGAAYGVSIGEGNATFSGEAYGVSIGEGNATFSGEAYGVSIGEGNATFSGEAYGVSIGGTATFHNKVYGADATRLILEPTDESEAFDIAATNVIVRRGAEAWKVTGSTVLPYGRVIGAVYGAVNSGGIVELPYEDESGTSHNNKNSSGVMRYGNAGVEVFGGTVHTMEGHFIVSGGTVHHISGTVNVSGGSVSELDGIINITSGGTVSRIFGGTVSVFDDASAKGVVGGTVYVESGGVADGLMDIRKLQVLSGGRATRVCLASNGTATVESGATVTFLQDITDADATAANVRTGKTFYTGVTGMKTTGTMPDAVVTSGSTELTVTAGYLDDDVDVTYADTSLADATADKVRGGKTFYAGNDTLKVGTMPDCAITSASTACTLTSGFYAGGTVCTYIDPTTADAVNAQVLTGAKYYAVDSSLHTGSMPFATTQVGANATTVTAGYLASNVTVTVPDFALADAVVGNVLSPQKFYAGDGTLKTGTMGTATVTETSAQAVITSGYLASGVTITKGGSGMPSIPASFTDLSLDTSYTASGDGWIKYKISYCWGGGQNATLTIGSRTYQITASGEDMDMGWIEMEGIAPVFSGEAFQLTTTGSASSHAYLKVAYL